MLTRFLPQCLRFKILSSLNKDFLKRHFDPVLIMSAEASTTDTNSTTNTTGNVLELLN